MTARVESAAPALGWAQLQKSIGLSGETATNLLATVVLLAPLAGATILGKLSVPPLGAHGIGIAFIAVPALAVLGLCVGVARIDRERCALLLLLCAFLFIVQIARNSPFSAASMLLFCILHFPYAFSLPGRRDGVALRFFRQVTIFMAVCGIAQSVLQFVVNARFLFPIDNLFPPSFTVQSFAHVGTLKYGSNIYRSNGVFALEPSFFSQLMAVAAVIELCTANKAHRLLLYGAAILVSYSGTGLILLAICVPLIVVIRRRWGLVLAGLAMLPVLLVLGEYLHVDLFLSRAGEFNSVGSSGFSRFVGGFYLFDQFLWADPWKALFGFGSGTFKTYAVQARYPVSEMATFKMIFEFGLVGALLYFSFIAYCLRSRSVPGIVSLAVGLTFILNGNYGTFAHDLALGLIVWTSGSEFRETADDTD